MATISEKIDRILDEKIQKIRPENIANGIQIFDVVGNANILNGEEKTVNPSINAQEVLPSGGHNGLTKVTVNAVTNTIDENIISENIRQGVSILGIEGNLVEEQIKQFATEDEMYNAGGEKDDVAVILTKNISNGFNRIIIPYQIESPDISYFTGEDIKIAEVIEPYAVKNVIKLIEEDGQYVMNIYEGSDTGVEPVKKYYKEDTILTGDTEMEPFIQNYSNFVQFIFPDNEKDYSQLLKQMVISYKDSEIIFKNIYKNNGNDWVPTENVFTAIPEDVLSGKTFMGTNGVETGAYELRLEDKTIKPTTVQQSISKGEGFDGLGIVTVDAVDHTIDSNIKAENISAGVEILGIKGTAPLVFATIDELNLHTDYPENTFAIVYGTSYVGTYKLDKNVWTQIGDSTEEVQVMNTFNKIDNTQDEYEGLGGTDEEINTVLNTVIGESQI